MRLLLISDKLSHNSISNDMIKNTAKFIDQKRILTSTSPSRIWWFSDQGGIVLGSDIIWISTGSEWSPCFAGNSFKFRLKIVKINKKFNFNSYILENLKLDNRTQIGTVRIQIVIRSSDSFNNFKIVILYYMRHYNIYYYH